MPDLPPRLGNNEESFLNPNGDPEAYAGSAKI
jgi:hypothetical protein